MQCIIKINMDNAAFEEDVREKLSYILKDIASRVSRGDTIDFPIMDINGNKVGTFNIYR